MRGFIANTEFEWFSQVRSIVPPVDEVNFWRPGSEVAFRALQPGEPLFFRLKSPRNAIGGFGYFAHYSSLPVSMAWEVYGVANGAASFSELRERLLRIRNRADMATDPRQDFWIGCILLNQPLLFAEDEWVRIPEDWDENTGQGKTYDLSSGEGQRVWMECLARAAVMRDGLEALIADRSMAQDNVIRDRSLVSGYGQPMLLRPRLGPRSFRIAVLDAYGRRCSVTNEQTLPALEAAHIRDYHDVQSHTLSNGILFRADIHRLFGAGYVTVTPELKFEVSRRIREEFENGREYYRLQGATIRLPDDPAHRPDAEALWWHNEQRFMG
jgi:putative restriction endonuclease